MDSLGFRLYYGSPVWVQNIAISGYGALLRYRRYGATQRSTLAALQQSQWFTAEQIQRLQLDRLNHVLAHAKGSVPLYADRDYPASLGALDELSACPIIEKDDLRAPRDRVIAAEYRDTKPVVIHTGGTTGKPLSIYCNRLALQRNYAFFERLRLWAGIRPNDRVATFAGRVAVPPAQRNPPFWRRNLAGNAMLFSSYHISPDTLPEYVKALGRFAPALIDSYPSSLEPVAHFVLSQGITSIRPTAVITSSETLLPEARATIEAAFGCRVFDYYGSAEMVTLVGQCDQGRYHVNPEYGIVEILRDGRPALPGEPGEIVATGFINPVMPLIRYRTGDVGTWSGEPCPCGRHFPTVERVEGRRDDVLITPDGRRIGRLDPIFKAVESIYESRIIQDAVDHVRVEVVPLPGFTRAEEDSLRLELQKRLGPLMSVDVALVESIPRTASGKFRAVINQVRSSTSL